MRIGLVSPYSFSHPGGVQNHVLGLAGWLLAAGHDPHILAPGPAPVAALARKGLDTDRFTTLGDTWAIPWNGSVARVSGGPRTARRVRRWLATHDLDVLHVHEPVTPSAALWAMLAARVPTVATFHLATPRSRVLALAGWALAGPLHRLPVTLAVSETAAAVVRDHLGLSPRVVPNGIDAAEFAGERHSWSPPWVVFLGRLTDRRKGLDVFLSAVPRLVTLAGPLEIVVAGPGERVLPPGVRAYGAPTDDERAALLLSADVVVAPHTGRESFGLVLVEALAAGAPVVASDLPAFGDVLTDATGTRFGRTFPTGNPHALARTVAATLADPGPGVAELRARAAAFDWQAIGPQVLAAYDEARRARVR